jgi:hypothetical protein
MDMQSDLHDERWSRAVAAAQLVGLALERDLPHMALAATREAARSALLVLAEGPRRLAGPDLALLRELAAAPPQHMAGRPAERQALVRAALAILDRLFLPPPSASWRSPPRGFGSGAIAPPDPGSPVSSPARGLGQRRGGAIGIDDAGGWPEALDPLRRPLSEEGPRSWA